MLSSVVRVGCVYADFWWNLDRLKYFGLYKFELRICDDPVLSGLAIGLFTTIVGTKVAFRGEFVLYDLDSSEVFGLPEETGRISKRACGVIKARS